MEPKLATPTQGQVQAVLESVLRGLHDSEACLDHWSAELVRELETRRVIRYDLSVRLPGSLTPLRHQWIGKFYDREETGLRVATILHSLASTDCSARGNSVFPTPIAWHPPLRLLLLTYQEGESVLSVLGHASNKSILSAIGRALAALHSAPVHVDAFSSTCALLADLEQRIDDLRTWLSVEPSLLRDILHCLQNREPPPPSRAAFLHGDFGPAQLLWQDDRLVILDFDKCTRGDAAQDLGNLLTQLRRILLRTQGVPADFASWRRSTLDAYRQWSPVDLDLPERLPWYELVILVRKIHFLSRTHKVYKRVEAIRLLGELPSVMDSV